MTLSAKKLEKLKKKLLDSEIDFELIPTYSGDCRLYKFKGFEIMVREKVMYSKNPIVGFSQEISALFRKKEHPPTEYILDITKVPNDIFNHLLNRTERIEYPTGLQKEKKEELQSEVFGKITEPIKDEIINFLNKCYRFEKKVSLLSEKERRVNQYSFELDELKQSRKCPQCGLAISKYALKCEKCREWVDNDVFRRLSNDDVELIKTKDLAIVTPSLVSLMIRNMIKGDLEEMKKKSDEKRVGIREAIFLSYCYSNVLKLSASWKTGKRNLLNDEINNCLISLALTLLEEISQDKKFNYNEALLLGLDLYKQLDKVPEDVPITFIQPDASEMFLTAQRMGEIIYGKGENMININIWLFLFHINTFKYLSEPFSKFFIVEEEDFDWKSMID